VQENLKRRISAVRRHAGLSNFSRPPPLLPPHARIETLASEYLVMALLQFAPFQYVNASACRMVESQWAINIVIASRSRRHVLKHPTAATGIFLSAGFWIGLGEWINHPFKRVSCRRPHTSWWRSCPGHRRPVSSGTSSLLGLCRSVWPL